MGVAVGVGEGVGVAVGVGEGVSTLVGVGVTVTTGSLGGVTVGGSGWRGGVGLGVGVGVGGGGRCGVVGVGGGGLTSETLNSSLQRDSSPIGTASADHSNRNCAAKSGSSGNSVFSPDARTDQSVS